MTIITIVDLVGFALFLGMTIYRAISCWGGIAVPERSEIALWFITLCVIAYGLSAILGLSFAALGMFVWAISIAITGLVVRFNRHI